MPDILTFCHIHFIQQPEVLRGIPAEQFRHTIRSQTTLCAWASLLKSGNVENRLNSVLLRY